MLSHCLFGNASTALGISAHLVAYDTQSNLQTIITYYKRPKFHSRPVHSIQFTRTVEKLVFATRSHYASKLRQRQLGIDDALLRSLLKIFLRQAKSKGMLIHLTNRKATTFNYCLEDKDNNTSGAL